MSFKSFILESIVDIPKNVLSKDVWDLDDSDNPVIKQPIFNQIASGLNEIEKIITLKNVFITGSILTKRYNQNSDIDVTVEVYDEDMNELTSGKVLMLIKNLNGKLAIGTTHKINFYILTDIAYNENNYEGIYDLKSNKWIKEPKENNFNIENYLLNFNSKVSKIDLLNAKLRRDLIDYTELRNLSDEEINDLKTKVQSKIYEISQTIDSLIDIRKTIKKSRDDMYSRPLNPEEIEKFSNKHLMPQNVIYKLLEKYYYWELINKLQEIVDNKNALSNKDIQKIKKAENQFFTFKESLEIPYKEIPDSLDDLLTYECGWLSPKGNFYSCFFSEHEQQIKNIKEFYDEFKKLVPDKMKRINTFDHVMYAYKLGWLRVAMVKTHYDNIQHTIDFEGIANAFIKQYYLIKEICDRFDCKSSFTSREKYIKSYFNESLLLTEIRKVKLGKINWKTPKYKSHLMKLYRGTNRKSLKQIPTSQNAITRFSSWRNLGTAKKIVDVAKKASSGLWRLSTQQVKEIANKYHHFPPTQKHPIKHLGNTGIMVWRKGLNNYFLIKPSKHFRR